MLAKPGRFSTCWKKKTFRCLEAFIPHTHHDYAGGCRAIQGRVGHSVYKSGGGRARVHGVRDGLPSISTPGHMAVHKIYHFYELGILFSGDALINGGCGRLQQNMEFALLIDLDNTDVRARLELYHCDPAAASFVALSEEKKTNPFLRACSIDEFIELRSLKDRF